MNLEELTEEFKFVKFQIKITMYQNQIEDVVKWVKKMRLGTAHHSTLSLNEVEKMLLRYKQAYKKLIRCHNKQMLNKNQVGKLISNFKFGDEAEGEANNNWRVLDGDIERFFAAEFFDALF